MKWLFGMVGLFVLCNAALADVVVAVERHYRGSLGNRAGIYLRLRTEGGQLSGSYAYDRIGTDIGLRGARGTGDAFQLQEFTRDKQHKPVLSGTFKGGFSGAEMTGQWTSADGRRTLPFRLLQVGATVHHHREMRPVELDLSPGTRKALEVTYPQVTGLSDKDAEARINATLRERVLGLALDTDCRRLDASASGGQDESAEEDEEPIRCIETRTYELLYNAAPLLSFSMDVTAQEGRSYPNTDLTYLVLDTKRGGIVRLRELIKKDRLPKLRQMLCRRLPGGGNDPRCNGLPAAVSSGDLPCYGLGLEEPEFLVGPSGLDFDLDCSPHAMYAAGLLHIPYRELGEFIDPAGPLEVFVENKKGIADTATVPHEARPGNSDATDTVPRFGDMALETKETRDFIQASLHGCAEPTFDGDPRICRILDNRLPVSSAHSCTIIKSEWLSTKCATGDLCSVLIYDTGRKRVAYRGGVHDTVLLNDRLYAVDRHGKTRPIEMD